MQALYYGPVRIDYASYFITHSIVIFKSPDSCYYRPEFDSQQVKDSSVRHQAENGSEARPAFWPMVHGNFSSVVKLTTYFDLVLKLRIRTAFSPRCCTPGDFVTNCFPVVQSVGSHFSDFSLPDSEMCNTRNINKISCIGFEVFTAQEPRRQQCSTSVPPYWEALIRNRSTRYE